MVGTFRIAVLAAMGTLLLPAATTYYVSKSGADDAAHTGKTWELAKKTIQAAVNLCAAGDTVVVGDGEYSDTTNVTISGTAIPTVVNISKQITLKSLNGKESTHIVGALANTSMGTGVGAHRGIYNTASGTLVQGFTIRDCATVGTEVGKNDRVNNGGAISSGSGSCTVVDCTIDNCRAGQGGASDYRVDFFRCLITRCRASGTIQVFYRGTYAANCIVANCGNGSGTLMPNVQKMYVANCTFIRNNCSIAYLNNDDSCGAYLYNCAVLGNSVSMSNASGSRVEPLYCVDSRSDGKIVAVGAGGHCVGGVSIYQYLSPAAGDWRFVAGNALKDAGCDDYVNLSWIPAAYRTDFFGRPRQVGTVDVGAVELQADETEATPATAFLRVQSGITLAVADRTYGADTAGFWYGFTTYPGQIRVGPSQDGPVFGYTVTHSGTLNYTSWRFPDCGDDRGFWYSPQRTGTTAFTVTMAKDAKWADANYAGGDSDGSEAKPYTTIQEAFNAAKTNGVVYVKPGVYATGVNSATGLDEEASPDGSSCRLSLWKNVAVRSVAGAEQTVIKGGSDVRVIVLPSRRTRIAQVQGFTLTGQDGSALGAFHAVEQDSFNIHVTDCVISNNVSTTSAMYGGWAERCLFRDNFTTETNMGKGTSGSRGTHAYGTALSACVLDYSPAYFVAGGYPVVCTCAAQNDYEIECTFKIPSNDATNKIYRTFNTANGTTVAYNNAQVAGVLDALGAGPVVGGNLASPGSWNNDWIKSFAEGTFFADAAAGDYHPLPGAPGLEQGVPTPEAYLRYEVGDFEGRPLNLRADGAPIPGAFQTMAHILTVQSDGRGSVSPSGSFRLSEGESITITALGDGLHVFRGWLVNGVTNLTDAMTFTYTMDETVEEPSLRPLFTNEIYVDADNGSDGNDGATPATAKQTLATATEHAVDGDVVYLAEGDYNTGTIALDASTYQTVYSRNTEKALPLCRGVLRAGVTLRATGDRAKTFVTGAYDPDGETASNNQHYGNVGPNAVRCLMAYARARVEGVTFRNGATRGVTGGPHDLNGGGCVLAPAWNATTGDASTAVFVNCAFQNGVARSGANVLGGVYYRCRFTGGTSFSSAGGTTSYAARHIQCLINRGGSGDAGIGNHHGLINCTIYNAGRGGAYDLMGDHSNSPLYPILNCVICTGGASDAYALKHVRNCIIRRVNGEAYPSFDSETCENLTIVDNWLETGVDNVTGALAGPSSLAVDAGVAADLATNSVEDCATDLVGTQRIYNGRIDAGCIEFDWRPIYAEALVPKHFTVESADASVGTNAVGQVTIPAGEMVATWRTPGIGSSAKVPVSVTGTGSLEVFVNDALVGTLTSADGALDYTLPVVPQQDNALRFVYTPGASDTGAAILGPFDYTTGFMLILR